MRGLPRRKLRGSSHREKRGSRPRVTGIRDCEDDLLLLNEIDHAPQLCGVIDWVAGVWNREANPELALPREDDQVLRL